MSPCTLARLGPNDLDRLRRLNAMFADAFEDPAHYVGAPPDDAHANAVLARDDIFVLVALDGTEVVGGLVAYTLPKLEQARSEVYLYDLAVAASHRRQGLATALIRQLQALARAAGAWVVYVQADRGDEPAIALYTRLGQREDVLHFDLTMP
jgi:aminoglycoside 3-N-acetyltransferase I